MQKQRILIAPTAFKGTLSPSDVARAIAAGVERAVSELGIDAEIILLPLADGGDGTLQAVNLAIGGQMRTAPVIDSDGKRRPVSWLYMNDSALVELASACGLALLGEARRPMDANTFALGQVIDSTLKYHPSRIYVAVGGSASTDGGIGLLAALGAKFFGAGELAIKEFGGGHLGEVRRCDVSALEQLRRTTEFVVLTDVENPLLGPNGAAAVFGPQKGANEERVSSLDSGLANFANVLEKATGRPCRDMPGAGAAGGTAFGLACALGAKLESGFDWIAEAANLPAKIAGSNLIITGEGCFDSQSLGGKVTGQLIKRAVQADTPVWVVSGATSFEEPPVGVASILLPARRGDFWTPENISERIFGALLVSRIFHNGSIDSISPG